MKRLFYDRNIHNYIYLSFILFPMETRSLRPYRIFLVLPWHPIAFKNLILLYTQSARKPHLTPLSSGPRTIGALCLPWAWIDPCRVVTIHRRKRLSIIGRH